MRPIDLRSDTVTKPSAGMREAMASADVGDDVYGEDPTVAALEVRVAALLGHEAGLFVPSGTMANQIAIRAHTEPGDEIIIEAHGHSFAYESGALGGVAGVQAKTIPGQRGLLDPDAIAAAINPEPDHFARTRMVVLENTANRGGGTIYPVETVEAAAEITQARDLSLHMDGARLWNAGAATGRPVSDWAKLCDSVSVCLSKGLGAPVGSVVVGNQAFIKRVHRFRKMYGGGMRQAGILAAAGLYALEHNLERLSEDHTRLRRLVEGLSNIDGVTCDIDAFPTNIAYVTVSDAPQAAAALESVGVLVHAMGPKEIRFVTHLDLDDDDIDEAIDRAKTALA